MEEDYLRAIVLKLTSAYDDQQSAGGVAGFKSEASVSSGVFHSTRRNTKISPVPVVVVVVVVRRRNVEAVCKPARDGTPVEDGRRGAGEVFAVPRDTSAAGGRVALERRRPCAVNGYGVPRSHEQ